MDGMLLIAKKKKSAHPSGLSLLGYWFVARLVKLNAFPGSETMIYRRVIDSGRTVELQMPPYYLWRQSHVRNPLFAGRFAGGALFSSRAGQADKQTLAVRVTGYNIRYGAAQDGENH